MNFQGNVRHFVDLFKIIFILIYFVHFFGVMWHALALFEIEYLEMDKNWLIKYGI